MLAALRPGLLGRAAALRGDRSESLFRRILAGKRALSLEDMARLALEAPRALVPPLAVLARALGYRLVRVERPAMTVPLAAACGRFLVSAAEAGAAIVESIARDRERQDRAALEAQLEAHGRAVDALQLELRFAA
jgi:hypothetical protein